MLHKNVGKLIVESISCFVEVDTTLDGVVWGKYLRIKVILDVTKPIRRGFKLKGNNGVEIWAHFKY